LRGGFKGTLFGDGMMNMDDIPPMMRPKALANIMRNWSRVDNIPLRDCVSILEGDRDIGGIWSRADRNAAASILKGY
tara:strand:- start:170 stop:400 length:231 start_codon:yes stop_codon:yes gene_type:complete